VQGVQELVAEENSSYDLIHSHYWLSGWVAQKLHELWHVPVIHMFHTLGRMKDAVARNASEKEVDFRSGVEQQIMDDANCIVAATPLDKEQMAQLYQVEREKIAVIPCGVDAEMFHPIPKSQAKAHLGGPIAERRMILFVGRLDPVKGLDTLLEAVCELAHADNKLTQTLCLAVIGGDAESASEAMDSVDCLEDLKRKFDLSELVVFLGSQEQSTLAYYYSAAEVCVMPSRYESFGMVALEAMACGTPVLASRVGGLTYTVQDGVTGLLVPESDPKALAGKLRLLLEDSELRERLGKQALAASRQYSWRKVAEQIAALYASRCERKAAEGKP
jgi:D-inositol-3-phosphate glycosyltransferase